MAFTETIGRFPDSNQSGNSDQRHLVNTTNRATWWSTGIFSSLQLSCKHGCVKSSHVELNSLT